MWMSAPARLCATAAAALLMALPGTAYAAAPTPVYAPANAIADPGVVREQGDFYVYSTGSGARVSRGDEAAGPWSGEGPALDDRRRALYATILSWGSDNAAPDVGAFR
ncbi:hypothetical protein [Catellatospora tritici]|uniref:hypothetical protein n=1 Tax=Catellatospora tritici TaxID=2851566 RepID=UPI001C2CE7CB|nr:hypothetical protein [Catellatospora tritici]MBV1850593.1 hypothetical protein [Catellatospora tritici]